MKYAYALAAIAGLAAAQPHMAHQKFHKKAAGDSVVTDWTVVTVTDVVTVYGPSPAAQPTQQANSPPPVVHSDAPKSSSSAVAVDPPQQQPTPSSQAPKEQPTPSQSTPAASSATQPASSPSSGSSSSSGGSGVGNYGTMVGATAPADCTKEKPCQEGMTTYTTGLGACGYDDTTNNQDVVALQKDMFGSVTNSGLNQPSNPLCNKKIQITNPKTGATAVGVIRDRCVGCTGSGGIDLSGPLWAKLNDNQPGNRLPVEWYFLD